MIAFVGNKLNMTQTMKSALERTENILGKRENAG